MSWHPPLLKPPENRGPTALRRTDFGPPSGSCPRSVCSSVSACGTDYAPIDRPPTRESVTNLTAVYTRRIG